MTKKMMLTVIALMPLLLLSQTNSPINIGTIIVEGTPISKYRVESVSTASLSDMPPEELPQTVDILTSDFIKETAPLDLHDLLRYQPGIYTGGKTLQSRTAGQYSIRGMSGSEVMLDGSLGLAGFMGTFMDASAFERIEIVKGPVGSTVGGLTSSRGPYGAGGSVNLIMKQPQLNRSFTEINSRMMIGEDTQRYRLTLDMNEPVIEDKLAVRIPANYEYGKSFWLPDDYRWRQSYFIAPSVLLNINDDLRIGLSTTFQYTDQPGYQGIPIYRGKPYGDFDWDSDISNSDMRDKYIGSTIQSWLEWDVNQRLTLRSGIGIAQADITSEHLGSSAFASSQYSSLPYSHSESDKLMRNYNLYQRAILKVDTGPVEHTFVGQGDYTYKSSKGRSYFEKVSSADNLEHNWVSRNYTDTHVEKYGAVLQDSISWYKFRLLGGTRIDQHKSSGGNTGDSFSPRSGLSFLPTEWLVFFGNISLTESPNFGYMKSETEELTSSWEAIQKEGGLRVSPVESLWLTLSVYEINQKNTPTYNDETTYYEEEGEFESRGVELSLSGDITENWSIYTAYAYNEYENKDESFSFDRYPPHSLTCSTSYRIPSGPLDDIVLGFAYRYRHKYDATSRGSYVGDDYYIDESHVFDISANIPLYKVGGPKDWILGLAVKNIFDEKYIESNRHYYQCFPGDPRVFEISLNAKF